VDAGRGTVLEREAHVLDDGPTVVAHREVGGVPVEPVVADLGPRQQRAGPVHVAVEVQRTGERAGLEGARGERLAVVGADGELDPPRRLAVGAALGVVAGADEHRALVVEDHLTVVGGVSGGGLVVGEVEHRALLDVVDRALALHDDEVFVLHLGNGEEVVLAHVRDPQDVASAFAGAEVPLGRDRLAGAQPGPAEAHRGDVHEADLHRTAAGGC
jgi:hypothetical protein